MKMVLHRSVSVSRTSFCFPVLPSADYLDQSELAVLHTARRKVCYLCQIWHHCEHDTHTEHTLANLKRYSEPSASHNSLRSDPSSSDVGGDVCESRFSDQLPHKRPPAHLLSRTNLLCLDGKQATFLTKLSY